MDVVKITPIATPEESQDRLKGMRMFTRGLLTGFMVGPLVAALIVVSGFWPVMGTAEPPAWETTMARRALTASVARMIENPEHRQVSGTKITPVRSGLGAAPGTVPG